MHLFVSFFKRCFFRRHRQRGRILLGLKLSIYLSLVFYKKMATLEIEIDEDLMD